ncbi:GNAT family N-acetyltransferase [Streptomyces sp. A7024]|uniref:GNAT family N-acetyltransferase n=1 Tax=Streptomyces coryli TaxID=1128680 RepID=A0A6G4U409_9ACTN|nr:GNAT family N-acetyltransferase [Streptomyces coryli]NGN65961.1 GNAT family N-acetyltransferase [Streptomyces coryli]
MRAHQARGQCPRLDWAVDHGVSQGAKSDSAACEPIEWSLRQAEASDLELIVDLQAVVVRDDLERLGAFDPHELRRYLYATFSPQHMWIVMVDGAFAGCAALVPVPAGWRMRHFYLRPELHNRGVGTAVLRTLLERADRAGVTVELAVYRGSAAQRLYERHGFTVVGQRERAVEMVRPATTP